MLPFHIPQFRISIPYSWKFLQNFIFVNFENFRNFPKKFLRNGALKLFKPVAKNERITENFENIFPKYSLKRIFRKFKLMKI